MSRFDEENIESTEEKKAKIEAQRKKTTTNIFLFFACCWHIIETLSIMIAMFILYIIITYRVLQVPGNSQAAGVASAIMMVVILVGGMILGFRVYVLSIRWFIKKYHYENKLTKEVLDRYTKMAGEKEEKK